MNSEFWHLRPNASERKLAEWDHDKMKLEIVKCPADPGFERNGRHYPAHQRAGRRLTNLSIVLPNEPADDFVWTWQNECLVKDHTLELLRDHAISGFDVKPVAVRSESPIERPPRLSELMVTGWGGMAKPESGIHLDESQSCSACGRLRYTGLVDAEQLIDKGRWDGSDYFIVWPMPRYIFVTERVIRLIEKHQLTGVRFQRISEIKQSKSVIPGYSPGRLSYWMPEKRAREIGEPLGIY
jgi:hypothetical protein